jgi:hypothetical protein
MDAVIARTAMIPVTASPTTGTALPPIAGAAVIAGTAMIVAAVMPPVAAGATGRIIARPQALARTDGTAIGRHGGPGLTAATLPAARTALIAMTAPVLSAARLTLRTGLHLRARAGTSLPLPLRPLPAATMLATVAALMLTTTLMLAAMIPVLRHCRRRCGRGQQHCGDHQSHPTPPFHLRGRTLRHRDPDMHPTG